MLMILKLDNLKNAYITLLKYYFFFFFVNSNNKIL